MCSVFLWFQKDGMYISNSLLYIVKLILNNKELSEIILYKKCVWFYVKRKKRKEKATVRWCIFLPLYNKRQKKYSCVSFLVEIEAKFKQAGKGEMCFHVDVRENNFFHLDFFSKDRFSAVGMQAGRQASGLLADLFIHSVDLFPSFLRTQPTSGFIPSGLLLGLTPAAPVKRHIADFFEQKQINMT